jgi:hypothetical protein
MIDPNLLASLLRDAKVSTERNRAESVSIVLQRKIYGSSNRKPRQCESWGIKEKHNSCAMMQQWYLIRRSLPVASRAGIFRTNGERKNEA